VVAARLRVSNSGLARGGITGPLTTAEIAALAADPPEWLTQERETQAEVRREQRRLAELRAEPEPAKPAAQAKNGARANSGARTKSGVQTKRAARAKTDARPNGR
jgi:hypothetical protein